MFQLNIQLSTVERVKDFVSAISDFDFCVDLVSGKYCVNGKSIMGIFSLDLSRPISLEAEVPEDFKLAFAEAVKNFKV
ncbi:MAG: HPr family phosphocarrier protein [Angelakisella sp.]